MAPERRILRPEDQLTIEQYEEQIRHYTDEDAQRLGYPNVEVFHLERRLGKIAGKWRGTRDANLVAEYRHVLYEMILNGYDVTWLPIQDQLPKALMPPLPPPTVRAAILEAYKQLAP